MLPLNIVAMYNYNLIANRNYVNGVIVGGGNKLEIKGLMLIVRSLFILIIN